MRKIALLLVAAFLFAFCAAEEFSTVVATFDGGCVYFEEIWEDYEIGASVYEALYDIDINENADIVLALQKQLVDDVIRTKLLRAYAAEQGAELISAADLEEIEELARRDYRLIFDESLPIYMEGQSEEAARAELEKDLSDAGLGYESYLSVYMEMYETRAALRLLAGKITVSDTKVRERASELAAAQEEYFNECPEDYTYSLFYGTSPIVYVPNGLRQVRVMRVNLSADEIQRFITTDDIASIYAAGVSAEDIYGLPGGTDGAPICANCSLFESEVVSAALALKKPGEKTLPIATTNGYVFAEYISDVKSGALPYKTIRDGVEASLIEEEAEIRGNAKLNELLEQANVQYFLYRLG